MLRIKLVDLFSIFWLFSYIVFVLSTEYGTEIAKLKGKNVQFQEFYSQMTETVYQCMEICSRYPLCKSLFHGDGICELLKNDLTDIPLLNSERFGKYVDASGIPKSIAGACKNNRCRNNTKCVPYPSQSYACLPHNLPVFACPKKWIYSNDKCFSVYVNQSQPLSWEQAKDHCAKIKTNLTEIRTTEEEKFISDVFAYISNVSAGLEGYNGTKMFWISLSYHENRRTWIWDASGQVWDNTSVRLLSPQYQNIKLDQSSCIALYVNTTYEFREWIVANCSSKGFFACEKLMLP